MRYGKSYPQINRKFGLDALHGGRGRTHIELAPGQGVRDAVAGASET